MYEVVLACSIGVILDLCFGDPQWMYHPIRLIGHLISSTEKLLRKWTKQSQKRELVAGSILVIVVCVVSTLVPFLLLQGLGYIHPIAKFILECIFCYQLLAVKSLRTESMKVYDELQKGDLERSRYAVSMIVGRDTAVLDEIGVTKATIETIAENTSDGCIAPLLYMMIGGPILGFLYKAINTMDSMVGYKNEKYLYFGRMAAKLDDIVNYIPARFSAWAMIIATYFYGIVEQFLKGREKQFYYSGKDAMRIYLRDRYNHASPNSAQTEAVCAGALQIQLAGDAFYFGKRYKKPYIGDSIRVVEIDDIKRSNQLLYGAFFVSFFICALIRLIVVVCIF